MSCLVSTCTSKTFHIMIWTFARRSCDFVNKNSRRFVSVLECPCYLYLSRAMSNTWQQYLAEWHKLVSVSPVTIDTVVSCVQHIETTSKSNLLRILRLTSARHPLQHWQTFSKSHWMRFFVLELLPCCCVKHFICNGYQPLQRELDAPCPKHAHGVTRPVAYMQQKGSLVVTRHLNLRRS